MNEKVLMRLAVILLMLNLVACRATPTPSPAPTSAPTVTSTPTSAATPWPSGRLDSGMGGTLTIRGIVSDDSGKLVPNVYVSLTVYRARGGWDIGQLAKLGLYTDGAGSFSFDKLARLESGHYEVWFNGEHEYGKAYENRGSYIEAHQISGDVHVLDVTVHQATGSTFSGAIQYEDADGSIKSFYSPPFTHPEPSHLVELVRGAPDNIEYNIGCEYSSIVDGTVAWPGLAGGTYHLRFTYKRSDGVLVRCAGPAFEILSGSIKRLEYTIRDCPPSDEPILPE
ncbi:MAG: carboxypeptidase regulatory-like domain-containing protein [Anaerolineae bacterium]|nr:carboxypeptidase regulatory-like domain-containing protein [Anaerolineae bacterium]